MKAFRARMTPSQREQQRAKDRLRMRARRAAIRSERGPPVKKSKKLVVKTTAERRIDTINRIRRQMDIAGTGLEFLRKPSAVIAFVDGRYSNVNTRLTTVSHIVGHLKTLQNWPLGAYREYMQVQNDARMAAYSKNKMSERDRKNWLPWPDILKARAKCTDPFDQAVMDFYLINPPRHTEYRELIVVQQGEHIHTDLDEVIAHGKGNYLVLGAFPAIVLNKYKGSKKKGMYISQTVPDTVLALARTTDHMQFLFKRSFRTSAGWSKLLTDTFEKYCGQRVGVNILRKSYVTWRFQIDPHMSEFEKKKLADRMGTSVGKLMLVYRLIDTNNNDSVHEQK